jgi:hypothetical protein
MNKILIISMTIILTNNIYSLENNEINVICEKIVVRDYPSDESFIIDYVFNDEKIQIIGRTEKQKLNPYWVFIKKQYGMKGWVNSSNINLEEKYLKRLEILSNDMFDKVNDSNPDLAIVSDDFKIFIDQPIQSIYNIMGEPNKIEIKQRNEYAESKWDDVWIEYENFRIHAMREWMTLISIMITNNGTFQTSKGIKIGSNRNDIRENYGIGYSNDDLEHFSYEVKNDPFGCDDVLWFIMDDDKVKKYGFNKTAD